MTGNADIDLTNCDLEPIQFLGQIQPNGYLVAASRDWHVRYLSANCGELFGVPVEEILGTPLRQWFSSRAMHRISGMLQLVTGSKHSEQSFALRVFDDDRGYNISVHSSGEYWVIELEACMPDIDLGTVAYVGTMIERLKALDSIPLIEKMACRFVRNITGYDRVMIYRFLEDGTGEVVAESVGEHPDSFLGLRYPASDIPKQARELYKRTQMRVIADVRAENVGIVALDGSDGTDLDLSLSVYRSVSPIHLQYLRNMGVEASFSSSIMKNDELAGLFACHHYKPRRVPLERRAAVEMFTRMYNHLRFTREAEEERQRLEAVFDEEYGLLDLLRRDGSESDRTEWLSEHLQRFVKADGLILRVGGRLRTRGDAPGEEDCLRILDNLNQSGPSEVFITDHLEEDRPELADLSHSVAGMIAIPVAEGAGDYLVYLRRPVEQVVRWAGNPDKPVVSNDGVATLSPRKSFEEWRETVRGRSEAWGAADRAMARRLRMFLFDVAERMRNAVSIERERIQAHQDILVEELNHRVRNIVNVVGSIVEQTTTTGRTADEYSAIIRGRIDAMAIAHDQLSRRNRGNRSLRAMAQIEFSGFLSEDSIKRVNLDGEPVTLSQEAAIVIALVLHELTTNAVKHGALSAAGGEVSLGWKIDDHGLSLHWSEAGGPVVEHPRQRGFGRTVIERLIPFDLDGTASIDFQSTGLTCQFTIPGRYVSEGDPSADSLDTPLQMQPEAAGNPASGGHIKEREGSLLIVEDNLLIAMDYETVAKSAGFKRIVTVSTNEDAIRNLDEMPVVAILDINLADENSMPIAEKLHELAVPMIFVTGYGHSIDENISRMAAGLFSKPVNLDMLLQAIEQIVDSHYLP